jgi:hypothetical protein
VTEGVMQTLSATARHQEDEVWCGRAQRLPQVYMRRRIHVCHMRTRYMWCGRAQRQRCVHLRRRRRHLPTKCGPPTKCCPTTNCGPPFYDPAKQQCVQRAVAFIIALLCNKELQITQQQDFFFKLLQRGIIDVLNQLKLL